MITDKTLNVLGVVALVLVAATAWLGSRTPTVEFEFNKGQLLVPDPNPDRIDVIEVQKGEDKVELRRSGKGFVVQSLRGYPAATREVNSLMRSALGIRCAAEVSSDPDAHEELRVAEGGEKATTVRFLDSDGKPIVGVVVGEAEDGAQYARLLGEDRVYRVDGFVSLRTAGLDFVDKKLAELKRDDIERVEVAPAEGKNYAIASPSAGTVELQGIPEGSKAKGSEPDSVFGAATWLNFKDFRSQAEMGELQFGDRYTVRTRDGAEFAFELARQDDKWWVRGKARYVGPEVTVPRLPDNPTEEQMKANEERLAQNARHLAAQQAVEDFKTRTASWVYEIDSWKAESMTKAFDALVEPEAPEGRPEKITASHILIPYQGAERAGEDVTRSKEEAKQLAEDLHAQVVADPSKFAELAKEHSSCSSAPQGGDLGEFPFEQMSKPFSEAAFALEVGAISEVVETEFGFHVIQRTK